MKDEIRDIAAAQFETSAAEQVDALLAVVDDESARIQLRKAFFEVYTIGFADGGIEGANRLHEKIQRHFTPGGEA